MKASRRRLRGCCGSKAIRSERPSTPKLGLQEAEDSHPDAIILDLRMPLVDGLGFPAAAPRARRTAATPGGHRHRRLFPRRCRVDRASRARRGAAIQAAVARGSGRPRPKSAQGDPLNESGSRFLKACRRQPVDATPVWFMRQAGRYMAEYRALRERYSLLDICRTPDLATEVTLQPVRRHRGGRGDPVLRSAAAARADGHPLRFHPRRRARDRESAAHRGRPRRASSGSSRAKRWRTCSKRSGRSSGRSAAGCRSSALPARRSRWRPTRSKAAIPRRSRTRRR